MFGKKEIERQKALVKLARSQRDTFKSMGEGLADMLRMIGHEPQARLFYFHARKEELSEDPE